MRYHWRFQTFEAGNHEQARIWSDLCERVGACAVQLPEFVFTCAEVLYADRLTLAVCEEGGAVVAAALLDRRRRLFPEVFVEPQMPLGAWVQFPNLDFVELASSLMRADRLALRLGALQLDSRFVSLPHATDRVGTLPYITTPWVEISGTFDAYWAARGKNLRTNMRRQRDRLAEQGIGTRMEVLTAPQDMARAVTDYADLESGSWKAEGGTALTKDHPQTRFYAEMLERCARRGLSRVYRYFFDDKLAITELCLLHRRELVILKTTYDGAITFFSPASLMRQEMFSGLFSGGEVDRVEFYGPLKDWHTRWTGMSRPIYHANVYRRQELLAIENRARRILGRERTSPDGHAGADESVMADPAPSSQRNVAGQPVTSSRT